MKAPLPKATYVNIRTCLLLILLLLASLSLGAQQLAFPTAKGAGAYSVGGRGGQVIHVTTLDWDAPGGLKEAIQTTGPRIIVFDVSGEIDATSEGYYTPIISGSQFDNLTIAGQTSPLGGITIRTSEFMFQNVSNVIIRYIRFRNDITSIQDAAWFIGGSDIIIDHCTFSHGGDESASMGSSVGSMSNVTLQNCFFQDSKTGTILGVDDTDGDYTFVNNVYSNISHRFPNPKGNGHYDIINNVVYNWKYRLIRITGEGTYNVINNYYKGSYGGIRQPGWFQNSDITPRFLQKVQTQANDNPLIYAAGSIVVDQREIPQTDDSDMWTVFAGSHLPENSPVPSQYFTSTQFPLAGNPYPILPGNVVYTNLLLDVGADKSLNADGTILSYRDDKDNADILMIQNDTYNGSFYDPKSAIAYPIVPQNSRPSNFDSNNDGMPDLWKISRGFQPDADLSSFVWPSGYIGVEEYLNEVDLNSIEIIDVSGVEVTPVSATINIPETIQLLANILPNDATYQNGTWSSSNEAIATVDNSGLVTPVSEGIANITFTTNDGGFVDFSTITVTNIIIDLQSVTISPESAAIELGESLQLNPEFMPQNATNISGNWSSSAPEVAVVDQNGIVTAITEGNTTITFTAEDGGFSDTAEITVIDEFFGTYHLYNAESDVMIQNIVEDTSINIADYSNEINFRSIPEGGDNNPEVESVEVIWAGPNNGIWVESDPIYAGLPNGHIDLNFESYIVEEGTYNFTVTYYSDDSATGDIVAIDTFSLTFFFSTLPVANAGPDQEICEGETAILTASGGPNFLWDNGETTASIEVIPLVTTIYTVSVYDDEGNFDEDSVTITVNPIPVAEAGENQTICEGETSILTATGGESYLWSNGEITASIEVSPIADTTYNVEVLSNNCSSVDSVTVFVNDAPDITISEDVIIVEGEATTLGVNGSDNYLWSTGETSALITVSPMQTTTYSVSSTGLNGCSTTLEVTVTVIPEVIADAGNDQTICRDDIVTLVATGGTSYLWSTGDTTAQLIVTPQLTTTYSVTVTDDYGYSDTDSVTITVNETPDITVSEDVAILEGESVTLTASGGNNYQWNTGDTTASIVVSPTVTTTYSVVSTAVGGCVDIEQVTVTIIPEVVADAGEDQTICSGESVFLNATGGISYVWNTGYTGPNPEFSPNVTTTYTVTVTDAYGYSDSDDVTIIVNETPIVTVSENNTIVVGESVNLLAEGANSYEWSTGETTNSIVVSPTQTTTYIVTGTTDSCSDQAEVTITVEGIFEASAGEDRHVCENDTYEVELTASPGDSYLWSTGETTQSIIVSPLSTTTYTVTVTEGVQQDTDDVTVYVDPNPNVVILNGDNVNIMNGDFVTLSATGANSYIWNNGATQPNIAVSPSQTTTYEVRGYINDCYDEKLVTVTVIPEVDAYAGEDVEICLGETVTLTATGGDEYEWSNGESTQSIQVSPDATTEYTVTVFNALDFDEDTVIVFVDDNCENNTVEQPENPDSSGDFSFDVFPNPAVNQVNVRLSGSVALSRIYLYDITGKLVHSEIISNDNINVSTTRTIDVSKLNPGMYYVKMMDINREISKKLIIK